ELGYRILDLIEVESPPRASNGASNSEVLERIAARLDTEPIDEVFVALHLDTEQPLIRAIVALCEECGTTVRLLASVVDLILARAEIDAVDGRPVITIFSGPPDSWGLIAKRMLDVALTVPVLVLLAPVFLVVAVAIKLDSPGPVFFAQQRVG